MNVTTHKKLQQQFTGKVCTIVTLAGKQGFSDIQFSDFFTGIVESVESDGVFMRHHLTKCVGFYPWQHVVGMVEEQQLDPDNPEHAKIIEELKNKLPEQPTSMVVAPPTPTGQPQFVDPVMMAQLSAQAEEMKKKMLRKQ
jgi:hypothetical protein